MQSLIVLRADQLMAEQIAQVDALVQFTLATLGGQTSRKRIATSSSQTPTYTARKRSREDFENAELLGRIRSQLLTEPQHIILPASGEYAQLAGPKKAQIVNILNAIVETYEQLDQEIDPN